MERYFLSSLRLSRHKRPQSLWTVFMDKVQDKILFILLLGTGNKSGKIQLRANNILH